MDSTYRKKSGSWLINVVIILAGLVGGYFYYSLIIKPNAQPIVVPDVRKDDTLAKFKDLKSIDLKLLADPAFRTLKILGEIPVVPGPTGKNDPFAP